jgi:protein-tyrosine phosphatase
MEGMPGDPRAVRMLIEKGFDGHNHESRLLTADMVNEADKIIVMENVHREEIAARYPEMEGKIYLLKSFLGNGSDGEIKDPHGRSNYHYRLCFAEIYMAIEGLIKKCI